MTNDEAEILSKMSALEKIRKYLPKLKAGEISIDQYDAVINYREKNKERVQDTSSSENNPPEEINCFQDVVSAFAGVEVKDDEPDKLSQKKRLLKLLSDNLWHDTPNIINAVYGVGHQGVCRISERVRENIADGYQIESRKKSNTVWEYRLINNQKTMV